MSDEQSTSARLAQTQRDLAASQADLSKALEERDWERQVVEMLRRNGRISAQVIQERNAWRREIWRALGIDMLIPVPDAAEAIRQLREQVTRAEQDRAEAIEMRDDAIAAQARIGERLTEDAVRIAAFRRDRDRILAELASARQELEQLRARLADFEALARAAIHYVNCPDLEAETGEPYDALVHVVRVHERNNTRAGGTDA